MSEQRVEPERDDAAPRRGWGERLLRVFLVLLLLAAAGHWWWGRSAERRLVRLIETYRQRGEPVLPSEFDQPHLRDEENAALGFRAAASMIDRHDDRWQRFRRTDLFSPFSSADRQVVQDLLEASAESLALEREASEKPGADWQVKLDVPQGTVTLPDLQPQRDLARLLAASAILAHREGDDAAALERAEQILAVSQAMERQPTLLSHLVAVEISSLASDCVGLMAPRLRIGPGLGSASPRQVRNMAQLLLDEQPLSEGRQRALWGERAVRLNTSIAIAGGAAEGALQDTAAATPLIRYARKPWVLEEARTELEQMTSMIDSATAATDWWALREKIIPSASGRLVRRLVMHYRGLGDRRLAATALAIAAYAADHSGNRPESLQDLVPTYLPAVPGDPFAADRQMGYGPDDPAPRVYSVGSDGKDDGGSAESRIPGGYRDRWNARDAVMFLRFDH